MKKNNKLKVAARVAIALSFVAIISIALNSFKTSAAMKTISVGTLEELKSAVSGLSSESTKIVVKEDIEVSSQIVIPKGGNCILAADGSARALLRSESLKGSMLLISEGASLTVDDSNLTISGNSINTTETGALIEAKGAFALQNGSLEKAQSQGTQKASSPCIIATGSKASVTVSGGIIRQNKSEAQSTASVAYLTGGSSFKMTGGSIHSNSGSPVVVENGSFATINGGVFEGNTADIGGAIVVKSSGSLTLKNGSFTGNKANNGSAIAILDGGKAELIAGKITDGASQGADRSGAIFIAAKGEAKLYDAAVYSNKNGAYVEPDGIFAGGDASSYAIIGNEEYDISFAKSDSTKSSLSATVVGGVSITLSSDANKLTESDLKQIVRSQNLDIKAEIPDAGKLSSLAASKLKITSNDQYGLYIAGKAEFATKDPAPKKTEPAASEAKADDSKPSDDKPSDAKTSETKSSSVTGIINIQFVFTDKNGKSNNGTVEVREGAIGDDLVIGELSYSNAPSYIPKGSKYSSYEYDEKQTAILNSGNFSKKMNSKYAKITATYSQEPGTIYLCFAEDSNDDGIPDYYFKGL